MTSNSQPHERTRDATHFRRDTAARHLLVQIPTAQLHETIADTRHRLFENKTIWDSITYIYILDANKHLKGVLSMKELLASPLDTPISDFATREVVIAHPHSHLSSVAARAVAHQLKSIPIVDDDGVFLGVIGTDTILSTISKEHVQNLFVHAGVRSTETFTDVMKARVGKLIEWRSVWLLAGLVGGMLTVIIAKGFEKELSTVVELAFFLPVMVYLGDAVNTQTQMLFVRGLMTETIQIGAYLRREIIVDFIIAVILSIVLGLFAFITIGSALLTTIVSISVFIIVSTAGTLAIGISLLLYKLHRDPAIGGGPFATIVQDITSLLIYFVVATAIL